MPAATVPAIRRRFSPQRQSTTPPAGWARCAFAVTKEVILPFSVTVYPSQTRFSHPAISLACAFNSSGKAGSCFPSMINWRYLSSHCVKTVRRYCVTFLRLRLCRTDVRRIAGSVINPPIIPARGQRHSPAHPHHSLSIWRKRGAQCAGYA